MRRTWLVAPAVGLILLLAPRALAKGAGLELDEQVERNEVLSADAVLYARGKSMAKDYVSGGPFYAYLSPFIPGGELQPAPPLHNGAKRLGPIEVRGYQKVGKAWTVRVGVDFTMPNVSPGSYRIDVCTDPCARTIEALQPTVTRVVAGPLEERLHERINNLEIDLYNAMHAEDGRLERRAKKALDGPRDYTRERFDEQNTRIGELEAAIHKVRGAADKPFPAGVAGIAFAIGALLASAGWFFAPKLAHRARSGEKKASTPPVRHFSTETSRRPRST